MLILKHLPISSFSENLAYIHKDCISYKIDEISALTKLEIHGGMQPIYAFLQIVVDENIVNPNEIALNNEAFQQISLPEGANVTILAVTCFGSPCNKNDIACFIFFFIFIIINDKFFLTPH